MRISDWSSDVCSSDLPPRARDHRRCLSRRGQADGGEGAAVGGRRRGRLVAEFRVERGCARHADPRDRSERTSRGRRGVRSEEHTSELQSLMRISYAVFCLKKKKKTETVMYSTP